MTRSMKMLALSACLTIVSLAVPLSSNPIAWVSDTNYSFFLQVALPRLGIAVSSIIGGYAGGLFLCRSKDKNLHDLALTMSVIAIAILASGMFISNGPYVLMYSLICPPIVGFGVMKLSDRFPLAKKSGFVISLIVFLLLLSIALLFIGISSTDWVMTIDFGTGFSVLFGALIGGLATNLMVKMGIKTTSEMIS